MSSWSWCCIVFDIDGMLFEVIMNFFRIFFSSFHVFFMFMLFPAFKKKKLYSKNVKNSIKREENMK